MVSTNDLSKGTVLKLDGELFAVLEYQHHKPGKGGAVVRTKLRNILKNYVVDRTFRADEKVEDVYIERRPMQFMYVEGESYHFMDSQSYEQYEVPLSVVEDKVVYLKENMEITASIYEGNIILIEVPIHVQLEVTYTEPGLKGDTVSSASKPATIETGATINVPLFVNQGDVIKIDTRTGTYVERV